ncbi:hypothetical protein Spob074 [Spilosoma obliqua nucleopolyhedrosis virus]|uniref:Uncharacterized protein n=1 Tax=Spilarctia obliqua nucleopolyhedrovirus TaxID=1638618 RepID=A0A7G9U8E8_9ABAC|nr:hypothetical protein Spob074 [Spilosoma obliqua nucleopolyhedrosis virus]QNN89379.1 hypothetical protein [Spilarctia obliqua nucleopolyhedrovirus]
MSSVDQNSPAVAALEQPNRRTLHVSADTYTVDGLKLKPAYVEYYQQLREIVELSVLTISKELNMKEKQEVYSLARQLYEILRGLFVDEPFKLWLETNAAQLVADSEFKKNTYKILHDQLQAANLKSGTFKNIVLNVLNNELSGDSNCFDTSNGYIKPNCIVLTFNCCDLTFEP